jgi:hypothetical protein
MRFVRCPRPKEKKKKRKKGNICRSFRKNHRDETGTNRPQEEAVRAILLPLTV